MNSITNTFLDLAWTISYVLRFETILKMLLLRSSLQLVFTGWQKGNSKYCESKVKFKIKRLHE